MINELDNPENNNLNKPAYTAKEVCDIFGGITKVTLWRLEKRGLLTPVPGLRRKLYSASEVARFIKNKRE